MPEFRFDVFFIKELHIVALFSIYLSGKNGSIFKLFKKSIFSTLMDIFLDSLIIEKRMQYFGVL